jgi:hypothetical protein
VTGVSVIEKSEQIQGEHVYQASTLVVCIASAVIASASQKIGEKKGSDHDKDYVRDHARSARCRPARGAGDRDGQE